MNMDKYLEKYGYRTTSIMMSEAADIIYFLSENAFYTKQMNQEKFDNAKKFAKGLRAIAADLEVALESLDKRY